MRYLKIDFVNQHNKLGLTCGMFLLVGGCMLAWVGYTYSELLQTQQELQVKRNVLHARQVIETTPTPEQKANSLKVNEALVRVTHVLARLSLPWAALFDEIEASIDDQVSLLDVEPDVDKRQILINAEARDLNAMLAYTNRLSNSKILRNAHVQSHQIQVQDAQRPIRFSVSAQWQYKSGNFATPHAANSN